MTELDKKILEIANKNWPQFVKLVGEDSITSAKICLLRKEKKSYGEILIRLNRATSNDPNSKDKITKHKIEYACKKCDDAPSC